VIKRLEEEAFRKAEKERIAKSLAVIKRLEEEALRKTERETIAKFFPEKKR